MKFFIHILYIDLVINRKSIHPRRADALLVCTNPSTEKY